MPARLIYFSFAAIIVSSCESDNNRRIASPPEKYLGPGWVCHVTPDEFMRAGTVIEKTSTNQYFFYKEIGPEFTRLDGEFGFPKLTLASDFSLTGLTKFLTGLGVDASILPADISYSSSYKVTTSYGDVKKTVLDGESAAAARNELAATLPQSTSDFYLIRESVSAGSADISISRSYDAQIGGEAESKVGDIAESIPAKFSKPIGICTISQKIENSLTSMRGVSTYGSSSRELSGLPASAVITRRK